VKGADAPLPGLPRSSAPAKPALGYGMRLDVALTPDRLDHAALPTATVLVVDVLRASTTMIAALGNGCAGIVPVSEPAEAHRRARAMGPGALVAGERKGRMIDGFDLGNSPLEMTPERVGAKTLIFTTSNGTRALLAVRAAPAVGVAALVNLSAAAAWAYAARRDVIVVCAGERGDVSLEDKVCAGLLIDRLVRNEPNAVLTEAARGALQVGSGYGKAVAQLAHDSSWGRHLALAGRAADLAACLVLDTTTLVPVFVPHIDKVVVGSR
jgi:2-phosphosulfolactate phosphatase